jgi:hypothetical protein
MLSATISPSSSAASGMTPIDSVPVAIGRPWLISRSNKPLASAVASSTVVNRHFRTAVWVALSRSRGRWIVRREFCLQIPQYETLRFLPRPNARFGVEMNLDDEILVDAVDKLGAHRT